MTKEGWLREERHAPRPEQVIVRDLGQLSLVLSPSSFETARHFKVAPHHLHCPLESHSTSRISSLLRRPRNMRLIYLPKPSYCWRQTRYRLPHSSRWHLESASWNIPNLLECLEPPEQVLSLQAVAVLAVAFLQHQRTRLSGAAQGRALRPRPSSACIITNSRGCSNSPCSAEILQTNNNLPYPPDDTYASPRHQERHAG